VRGTQRSPQSDGLPTGLNFPRPYPSEGNAATVSKVDGTQEGQVS
jgi:hypothetical protein